MNRYAELEVKYDASNLTISEYHDALSGKMDAYQVEDMRSVVGLDTFYSNPKTGLVLRYRRKVLGDSEPPCLTYKKRKSPGQDSVDRHEVDLFLNSGRLVDEDVAAFVAALGCEAQFTITKESYIYDLHFVDPLGGPSGDLIVALYDVMAPGKSGIGTDILRFLEIEVNKVNPDLQDTQGPALLNNATVELEERFKLASPLGVSLYELLGPHLRPELYIPGTF